MNELDLRGSQDLIDQSNLARGRAPRRIARSKELIKRTEHRWEQIAVGRVCSVCRIAQANAEFDDTVPCEPKAS